MTLVSPDDDSSLSPAPVLPEKRKSYASTTSSRASSVFSDSAPDHTCPLSPFSPSNNSDRLGNATQQFFPRDSRGSSMPSGSSISTLSPTTPRTGGFAYDGSSSSGPNGYSYVTPPTTPVYPQTPYDYVSSPTASVASWVSENTSYFSASSSFSSDILSPESPPRRGFNSGMQPSSTPQNVDLFAGTSPTKNDSTPPLIPLKGKQNLSTSVQKVESWSETTSTVTSSTRVESRDESGKPRTPVPAPRRSTVNSSSLSRSVSDVSDERVNVHGLGQRATPPPITPRKSLHFPADHGGIKSPPPKPPRPSQSSTKQPPPKPKPYASKSAETSPVTQRKPPINIPPSEGQGT